MLNCRYGIIGIVGGWLTSEVFDILERDFRELIIRETGDDKIYIWQIFGCFNFGELHLVYNFNLGRCFSEGFKSGVRQQQCSAHIFKIIQRDASSVVILLQSGSCLSAVKFFIFICPFIVVSLSIPPKAWSTSFRWGTKLPVGGASILASIIILPFTVSISGRLMVSNITGTVWKSRPPVSFSLRKLMEVSLARLFTDKTLRHLSVPVFPKTQSNRLLCSLHWVLEDSDPDLQ